MGSAHCLWHLGCFLNPIAQTSVLDPGCLPTPVELGTPCHRSAQGLLSLHQHLLCPHVPWGP